MSLDSLRAIEIKLVSSKDSSVEIESRGLFSMSFDGRLVISDSDYRMS